MTLDTGQVAFDDTIRYAFVNRGLEVDAAGLGKGW
ncbi:MAG: hypothetical protein K0S14_1197 [Thermomicrobiales bacterium]|nr:hypothetical protein [Thermomicrobiales bacterium]